MASGIKDKVAILGMGCTKFGERWNDNADDLMIEAFTEALQDAGIEVAESPGDMGVAVARAIKNKG